MSKTKERKWSRGLSLLLTFALMLGMIPAMTPTASAFSGGSGTASSPYLIASAADFKEMIAAVNGGNTYSGKYFKQTATFTLDSTYTGAGSKTFSGTYDGDFYLIVVRGTTAPLFPKVASVVKNVRTAGESNSQSIIASELVSGGILLNCGNAASISAANFPGEYLYIGPLARLMAVGSRVVNSYNTGSVTYTTANSIAELQVSGLVGRMTGGGIFNAYNAGKVSLTGGGTASAISTGTITFNQCYFLTGSAPNGWTATGYSEAQMTAASFKNTLNNNRTVTQPGMGITASQMAYWGSGDGRYPVFQIKTSYSGGSGTAANPYQISTAADLVALTEYANGGGTYSNTHFIQTADIAINDPTYKGMDMFKVVDEFDIHYDGQGHTINVINSGTFAAQAGVFTNISGTVMNLGFLGHLKGGEIVSPVRTLTNGAVVNCYSRVTSSINTGHRKSGISNTINGTSYIGNTYFAGDTAQPMYTAFFDIMAAGAVMNMYNDYWLAGSANNAYVGGSPTGAAPVSKDATYMKSQAFVDALNNGRATAASGAGVAVSKLCMWGYNAGGYPVLIAPQEAPSAPTKSTQTDSSVTLNVLSGQEYTYTTSTTRPGASPSNIYKATSNTTRAFTGLTRNTTYYFWTRMAAKTGYAASDWSGYTVALTNRTSLTSVGISGTAKVDNTLTANFAPAAATVSYQWQWGNTSTGTFNNISGATSKSYTVAATYAGRYIRVQVTGTGSYQGTMTSSATAAVANTSQSAPTAPVKNTQTDSSVTVNVVNGQEYTYTTSTTAPGSSPNPLYKATSNTTYTFTGLNRNTTYYFWTRMAAKTGYAASPWSVATPAKTNTTALTSVTMTSANGTFYVEERLTASYAPAGATGTYQWQQAASEGGPFQNITGATSATFTPDGTYVNKYVRVQAFGSGNYGGTVSSTAKKITGVAPNAPQNVTVVQKDANTVTVSWTAATGAIPGVTKYTVYYDKDGLGSNVETNGTTTTVDIDLSVLAGQEVSFTVKATNVVGDSPASTAVKCYVDYPPAAPTGVTAQTAGHTSATVNWTAATVTGTAVKEYKVYYEAGKAPTTGSKFVTAAAPATTATVTGLSQGLNYQFAVVAVNTTGGVSVLSDTASAIPKAVPAVPAAPTLTRVADGGLNVSWVAPDNMGDAITKYIVYYAAGAVSDQSASMELVMNAENTKTALIIPVSKLTLGTEYQVAVLAVNGVGASALSEATVLTTANVPAQVETPLMVSTKANTMTITVVAPAHNNSALTGYEAELFVDGVSVGTQNVDATALTFDVTETVLEEVQNAVKEGVGYTVRVRAKNGAGWGEWSTATTEAVMSVGVPAKMAAPTLKVAQDGTVHFAYVRPDTHTNDDTLMGYHVYAYSDAEGKTLVKEDNTVAHDSLAASLTLAPGTYYVKVAAKNAFGEGPASELVKVDVSTLRVNFGETPASYIQGERLNPTAIVVTLTLADGTEKVFALNDSEQFAAMAEQNIKMFVGTVEMTTHNQRLNMDANGGKISFQRVDGVEAAAMNNQVVTHTENVVVKQVLSLAFSGTLNTNYSVGERLNFTTGQSDFRVRLVLAGNEQFEVRFSERDRYGLAMRVGETEITEANDKAQLDYVGKKFSAAHVNAGSRESGLPFTVSLLEYNGLDIIHTPTHGTVVENPFAYAEGELFVTEGMIVQFRTSATSDKSLSPLFIHVTVDGVSGFRPVKYADLTDESLSEETRTALVTAVQAWGIEQLADSFDIGLDKDGDGLSDGFNGVFGTAMKVYLAYQGSEGLVDIESQTPMSTVRHDGKALYIMATSTLNGETLLRGAETVDEKDGTFAIAGRQVDYMFIKQTPGKTTFKWGEKVDFSKDGGNTLSLDIYYTAGLPELDVTLDDLLENNGLPLADGSYWYGITNVKELEAAWMDHTVTWADQGKVFTVLSIGALGGIGTDTPGNVTMTVERNTLSSASLIVNDRTSQNNQIVWKDGALVNDLISGVPMNYDNLSVYLEFANGDKVFAPYGKDSNEFDYVKGTNMKLTPTSSEAVTGVSHGKYPTLTYSYFEDGKLQDETVEVTVNQVITIDQNGNVTATHALPTMNVIQDFSTMDVVAEQTAGVSGLREITLSWKQIGEDRSLTHGYGTISAYEVYCLAYSQEPVLVVPASSAVDGVFTTVISNELEKVNFINDSSAYTFEIRAINEHGNSSTPAKFTAVETWSTPKIVPTGVVATYTQATATLGGYLTVTWDAVDTTEFNGEFLAYEVRLYDTAVGGKSVTRRADKDQTSIIFAGDDIEGLGFYATTVAVVSEVGVGTPSRPTPGLLSDVPGAVADIFVKSATANTITVEWAPPTLTGGNDISGYDVFVYRNNEWEKANSSSLSAQAREFQVAGLEPGKLYRIGVRAANLEGASKVMAEVEGATMGLPASTTIDQVLTKTTQDGNYLHLTWKGADLNGASNISKYSVYAQAADGALTKVGEVVLDVPVTDTMTSMATTYQHSIPVVETATGADAMELVKGETYQLMIVATTGTGSAEAEGSQSKAVTAIAHVVESLRIDKYPTLNYIDGEVLDLSALSVRLVYNDGTESEAIPYSAFADNHLTAEVQISQNVSISHGVGVILAYNGKEISVQYKLQPEEQGEVYQTVLYDNANGDMNISVRNKKIKSLRIAAAPDAEMVERQPINMENLAVEITYDNGLSGGIINYNQFDAYNIKVSYLDQVVPKDNLTSGMVRAGRDGSDALRMTAQVYAEVSGANGTTEKTDAVDVPLQIRAKQVNGIFTVPTALPIMSFAGGSVFDPGQMSLRLRYDNNQYGGPDKTVTLEEVSSKLKFQLYSGTTYVQELTVGVTVMLKEWNGYNVKIQYLENTVVLAEVAVEAALEMRDAKYDRIEIVAIPEGMKQAHLDGDSLDLTGLKVKVHLENDTYLAKEGIDDETRYIFTLEELLERNFAVKIGKTAVSKENTKILLDGKSHNGMGIFVEWRENGKEIACVDVLPEGETNSVTVYKITGISPLGNKKVQVVENDTINFSEYALRIVYEGPGTDGTGVVSKVEESITLADAIAAYNLEVFFTDGAGVEHILMDGDTLHQDVHNGLRLRIRNLGNREMIIEWRVMTVIGLAVETIAISGYLDAKTTYYEDDKFDFTKIIGTVSMNNGVKYDIAGEEGLAKLIELHNDGHLTLPMYEDGAVTSLVSGTVDSVKIKFTTRGYSSNLDGVEVTGTETVDILQTPVRVWHREGLGFNGDGQIGMPSKNYVPGQRLDLNGVRVSISKNDGSTDRIDFTTNAVTLTNSKPGSEPVTLAWNAASELLLGQYGKLYFTKGNDVDTHIAFIEGISSSASATELAKDDTGNAIYARYVVNPGYSEWEGGLDSDYADIGSVTVVDNSIIGIQIETLPKMTYVEGKTVDMSQMQLTVTMRDGSTETVNFEAADTKYGMEFYVTLDGGNMKVTGESQVAKGWDGKNLIALVGDVSATSDVGFTIITQSEALKTATVLSYNHNSAKLQWQAPDQLNHGAMEKFLITLTAGSNVTEVEVPYFEPTGTNKLYHYTVENLTIGTDYTIQVAVVTEWGVGIQKDAGSIHTWGTPTTTPGSLSLSDTTISWTPPVWTDASFAQSTHTGYQVTITERGAGYEIVTLAPGSTSFNVDTNYFEDGKTYTFEIAAMNEAGVGSKARLNNSINLDRVPEPAGMKRPVLVMNEVSATSISYTWEQQADVNYTATLYRDSAKLDVVETKELGNTAQVTFTDLVTGDTYYLVVTASKDGEIHSREIAVTTQTMATVGTPANVSALAGDTTLDVSWDAVTSAVSYKVYVYAEDGTTLIQELADIVDTTTQVTGLTNDTVYKIQVSAIGNGTDVASSEGVKSEAITATPGAAAATVTSIEVTKQPTKTSYHVGEVFDPAGMEVTATYSDNSTQVVTGYTLNKDNALTLADTSITVTFEGKTATVAITVSEATAGVTVSGKFSFNGGTVPALDGIAEGVSHTVGAESVTNAGYTIEMVAGKKAGADGAADTTERNAVTFTVTKVGDTKAAISITLYDMSVEQNADMSNISVKISAVEGMDTELAYEFDGVDAGAYTVVVTKKNHTLGTITNVQVENSAIVLVDVTCYAGDLNGDNRVTIQDKTLLVGQFTLENDGLDLNGDGKITIQDKTLLVGSFTQNGMTVSQ